MLDEPVAKLGGSLFVGQGWFDLDNSELANGVVINAPGNWLQWRLWRGSVGTQRHKRQPHKCLELRVCRLGRQWVLVVVRVFLQATYANQTMKEGTMTLGTCLMPDVTPAGRTVTLALVVWDTAAPSFAAFLNSSSADARAGIIAFPQPTSDPAKGPPPVPSPLAWGVAKTCFCTQPLPAGHRLAAGRHNRRPGRHGGLQRPGRR